MKRLLITTALVMACTSARADGAKIPEDKPEAPLNMASVAPRLGDVRVFGLLKKVGHFVPLACCVVDVGLSVST
jgi:hypothetical protein